MTVSIDAPDPVAERLAGRAKVVALVVAVSFFMQLLDSTIVVTSLPQMASAFGIAPVGMSVGLTIYMLTMAAFIPLAGWLGDRFGARNIFMLAIAIFTAASFFCGLSNSLGAFTISRAVQGFAAALMTPVGRVIVLRNAPKSELVNAVALITWPALIAPVVGPMLGSFITTYLSWRWNFFINIPIGIAGLALVWRFVPDAREREAGKFDTIGFILSSLSLTLLLAGLEAFAHEAISGMVITLLLIGGTVFGLAATWHFCRADTPLLNLSSFAVPTFAISTLSAGTAMRVAINATPFLIPLLFQVGFGFDAVTTGIYLLAYFAGNLAMKSITTPTLRLFGFRSVLTMNGLLASGSIAACALLSPDTSEIIGFALLFFAGLTRSMQFTALNTIGFADIAPAQRSSASTLSSMFQQVSMLLGIAIAAALLNLSQMLRDAAAVGLPDFRLAFIMVGLLGALASLRFLVLPPDAGAEVSRHTPRPLPGHSAKRS